MMNETSPRLRMRPLTGKILPRHTNRGGYFGPSCFIGKTSQLLTQLLHESTAHDSRSSLKRIKITCEKKTWAKPKEPT